MKRKSVILSICIPIGAVVLTLGIILCVVFVLGHSDYKEYEGKHKDLYTEACHSLLFTFGFLRSEDIHQSAIDLIEEDEYGRKLFSYYERQFYRSAEKNGQQKYIFSLLISQGADNEYVYYYPDCNYYSVSADNVEIALYDSHRPTHVSNPNFTEEEISALKEQNDWNKELQIDKCIKQKIITKKIESQINKTILNKICSDIIDTSTYRFSKQSFLCQDNYGRQIYGLEFTNSDIIDNQYYAIILNPDLTYDKATFSKEIFGPFNCQQEMIELKQNNNWNNHI